MYLIQTVSSAPVARRASGSMEGGGPWPPAEKKKWSIGKLFRRKKKDSESEASSASTDENSRKNNAKRKKTSQKKRSSVSRSNFDDIVVNEKRSRSVTKFPQKEYSDEGVLSDPSAGFVGYVGRGLPRSPLDRSLPRSEESPDRRGAGSGRGSCDGSLRKGRKGRIKARIEAIRNVKNDSSSDEESQKSTSSSVFKFKSDDSLANHSKDGSVSKRSRSARNDRYIKRLSRDDESLMNDEADSIQKGFSRSELESVTSKRRILSTPQINDKQIIDEPDYSEPIKIVQSVPYDTRRSYSGTQLAAYTHLANSQTRDTTSRRHPALSASNSSVYSYPAGIINFNAQVNDENIKYSVPYNVNKQIRPEIPPNKLHIRRSASVEHNGNYSQSNLEKENIMVVKLPLGSVPKKEAAPPPPPPRDPQRKVPTPISYMYDNTRPLSYAFESGSQRHSQQPVNNGNVSEHSPGVHNPQNIYENSCPKFKNNSLSWGKRPISSSVDHIAVQMNYPNNSNVQNVQPRRPSSVSAEVNRPELYNRYLNRPQISKVSVAREPPRRHTQENANPEFLYFADKTPRSRRPIHIAPSAENKDKLNVSISNTSAQPKNASDFWRKMDTQEIQRRQIFGHNRALSDQSIAGLHNRQNLPLNVRNGSQNSNIAARPAVVNGSLGFNNRVQDSNIKNYSSHLTKNEVPDKPTCKANKENESICYSNIDIIPMDDVRPNRQSGKYSVDDHSTSRRKSTNLEDALSELEAIYNSLGLGDEDLLDRAERQEMMASKTKDTLPYSSNENYFKFPNTSDGPNNDLNRRGSLSNKQSYVPDKVNDDMAFRRMNPHERPKSKDANNLVTQVSYMLASPVLVDIPTLIKKENEVDNSEPDVIFDDVVFRNIRQANNYLKIEDPQPPFGIPIGPISPAPNSDYLHAVPDVKYRSRFIPQHSPDIVADDLAYRTLRKDSKNPSPVNKDNPSCIYNNTSDNTNLSRPSKIFDNHVIKKKRAVRSLSANIFTLIQREIDDALDLCNSTSMEKAQSIPDLPESVVEFGKSGKLSDSFKSSQRVNKISSEIKPKNMPDTKSDEESKIDLRSIMRKEMLNKPDEVLQVSSVCSKKPLKKTDSMKFQDELDTIADEANETSAKLVIALEELQKDKLSRHSSETKLFNNTTHLSTDKKIDDYLKDSSASSQKSLITQQSYEISQPSKINEAKCSLISISQSVPNIKIKGTIPAHIKEKMEEFSRPKILELSDDSSNKHNCCAKANIYIPKEEKQKDNREAENRETGKHTEDSLIAISNQLKIVECKLKNNNSEKPDMFEQEGFKLQYLANKCESDLNANCLLQTLNNIKTTTNEMKSSPANHVITKYEFSSFDGNSPPKVTTSKTKLESINNMQSFDELRKGISELLDGIGHVSEKLNLPKPTTPPDHQHQIAHSKESSIEETLPDKHNYKSRDSRGSPEYNSSEELAMIFNLTDEPKPSCTNQKEVVKSEANKESHLELSSPRLVKTANQNLRKLSLEEPDSKVTEPPKVQAGTSAVVSTSNGVPWRKNRQSATDNANKGTCDGLNPFKRRTWYHDPHTLMLACYYSLICTQQLAGLDVLTSLGVLLAVIIIIAMLML